MINVYNQTERLLKLPALLFCQGPHRPSPTSQNVLHWKSLKIRRFPIKLVFMILKPPLCAKLQTGLIPPMSEWTNLSVCSTRWTRFKKKPNYSSELSADFLHSTSHWINFILEEIVQLKVFMWFDCSSRNSLVLN